MSVPADKLEDLGYPELAVEARKGSAFAENRLAVVRINPKDLFDHFNAIFHTTPNFAVAPAADQIPEGVGFVSCNFNPASRVFEIVVCHQNFEIAPPNTVLPVIANAEEFLAYEMKDGKYQQAS